MYWDITYSVGDSDISLLNLNNFVNNVLLTILPFKNQLMSYLCNYQNMLLILIVMCVMCLFR